MPFNVVFIVFSLTDYESFEYIEYWIELASSNTQSNSTLILVGNKSDDTNKRVLNSDEIIKLALKHNIKYIEVSAKSGDGIQECFQLGTYDWLSNRLND